MDITLTARHCSVSDATRQVARKRLERLVRFHPRAASAAVIFSSDHGARHVEVHLSLPGNDAFARGSGRTFRTALDQAGTRLAGQLKRRRELVRRRAVDTDVTSGAHRIG